MTRRAVQQAVFNSSFLLLLTEALNENSRLLERVAEDASSAGRFLQEVKPLHLGKPDPRVPVHQH